MVAWGGGGGGDESVLKSWTPSLKYQKGWSG